MKNNNIKGFSIIFAIFITTSIMLMLIFLIEYMVPYWRTTVWIENSIKSYYKAMSWFEISAFNKIDINNSENRTRVYVSGSEFPHNWKWDSPFDKDYNIFSNENRSFNLRITSLSWINFFNTYLSLKTPNLDWDTFTVETPPSDVFFVWSLSSSNNTIFANWQNETFRNIAPSNWVSRENFWWKIWKDTSSRTWSIDYFARNSGVFWLSWIWNCSNLEPCDLTITMLWNLPQEIPFIEYKIEWLNPSTLYPYVLIDSVWKINWYQKEINSIIRLPEKNSVSDFTFQN